MPEEELESLRAKLAMAGLRLKNDATARAKLTRLRSMYEPYVHATGRNLVLKLPPWKFEEKSRDNWQAGPWDRVIQAQVLAGIGGKGAVQGRMGEDHF